MAPHERVMVEASDTREKRSGVIIRAAIVIGDAAVERRVRNLSRFGACVDSMGDLVEGTTVRVSMGSLHDLRATVMWARPHLAGLHFDQPVDLEEARRPRTLTSGPQAGWMADMNNPYRRGG
jgi:hypothetical protein